MNSWEVCRAIRHPALVDLCNAKIIDASSLAP